MAVDKLPHNLKEKWWFHVDNKDEDWPDLVMFEKWLARMTFLLASFSIYEEEQKVDDQKTGGEDQEFPKGLNFTANSNEKEPRKLISFR